MSENEVATIGGWGIEKKQADESLAKMQQSSFLPRIQFISKMSKFVDLDPGINANNFGLISSDEEYKDCGKTLDVMVLGWRQKALDTKEGKSFYDHQSDGFIEIQTRADTEQNSGCMYGPEYFVYIPEEDACATFFFGSKSLRYEVRKIHKLYDNGEPATLFGKLIEPKSGNNPYYSASVKACASPIAPPEASRLEQIKAELKKFNDPKDSVEATEPEGEKAEAATNRVR